VWDGVAEKMSARLVDVTTPEMAAALLEREIIGRLAEAPKPDPVVGELVRRLRPWRARRVTDQTCDLFVSPRQLRRRCLDALGFGPKTLHRILRFQAFFALVHYQAERGDLTQLATRSGYADQAHLSRECLRLSGLTPRAFVADRLVNCVGSGTRRAARNLGDPRRGVGRLAGSEGSARLDRAPWGWCSRVPAHASEGTNLPRATAHSATFGPR
jgi:AraC-like DNA-binding protein